jgi:hypothetical protein
MFTVSFAAAEDALIIQKQVTVPSALQAGSKDVSLQLDFSHTGHFTYKNITITLNFPEQFESIKDTYTIDEINPGQVVTTNFRFNVKDNVDPGTYTVRLIVSYIDTGGPYPGYSIRQIYIPVSSTPKLVLTDILFNPTAHISKTFDAIFTVNNTAAIAASNILAGISLDSNASVTWVPDSQIIDYIPPYSLANITFKGIVSLESKPGAYDGSINLVYSNKSLSNKFILEVHGTPDLKIAGSQTDVTPYAGEKFTLSVQLEDVGKEKARSVQATINDSAIIGTLTSYAGTIESDDTGSAIFDITIGKGGNYTIPLEFSYTDDEGNTFTKDVSITLFLYNRPFNFTWIILLVIIIAAAWYWQSRQKKKRRIERIVD